MKDKIISISTKDASRNYKKKIEEKGVTREQREKMIRGILNKNYRVYDRLAEI